MYCLQMILREHMVRDVSEDDCTLHLDALELRAHLFFIPNESLGSNVHIPVVTPHDMTSLVVTTVSFSTPVLMLQWSLSLSRLCIILWVVTFLTWVLVAVFLLLNM